MTNLHQLSATEVVALLKSQKVSPLEVTEAAISRIQDADAEINAVPVRDFERARSIAKEFRFVAERRDDPTYLAGLPFVAKEYNDIEGLPTTYGSTLYRDRTATSTDVPVSRIISNGGIPLGKTNVPEFAGANTFNAVYGATRNPWCLDRTAGGSSGGAAASLASRTSWLAMGSDLGGSLRIPASFCGVVGMRPSPGRIARGDAWPRYDALLVEGPMARNVTDVALMFGAQVGRSVADPLSWPAPSDAVTDRLSRLLPPTRVGFSSDLGIAPVDPEVASICRSAAGRLADVGIQVTEEDVDFRLALDVFDTLRAQLLSVVHGDTVRRHADHILPAIVKNVEQGFNLTADDYLAAETGRTRVYEYMLRMFDEIDILLCPTVAVPPFPVDLEFPTSVAGRECQTYIDWMFMTSSLTVTGCPIVSIPCGFTHDGLPVGIQVVGRPGEDERVIGAAAVLERELDLTGSLASVAS
ncbi:amidase [Nocardioides caldifontis]|uniref:amidase n=1 Tax=Nocardioides caldifontis TaxID=2588938 RepID=UPI00193A1FDC|nr:amidase [Nocardioides caldifontis]